MPSAEDKLNTLLESREELQSALFEVEPSWREHWWGMPEFDNKDLRPYSQITVNFATAEDRADFVRRLGGCVPSSSSAIWWPPRDALGKLEFYYSGEPIDSKYPVCIPSKGRADVQTTGRLLDQLGVSYKFFVEETEAEAYAKAVGKGRVVVLPFHDLGQGSIPARNSIWEWCRERGHARHWTLDDNITDFDRAHLTRRLRVTGGGFFRAMEDFADRYENLAMVGPHAKGFARVGHENVPAVRFNTRVYSCILLDTTLPHRWRGRYNEDTDLSLRLLKDGYCTCVFGALLFHKTPTAGVRGHKHTPGGNTDNVYNTGDHRRAFAESLRDQHPDVVKVVWKFGRWHHQVDYSPFRKNKPILRADVTPTVGANNYGMVLTRRPDKG